MMSQIVISFWFGMLAGASWAIGIALIIRKRRPKPADHTELFEQIREELRGRVIKLVPLPAEAVVVVRFHTRFAIEVGSDALVVLQVSSYTRKALGAAFDRLLGRGPLETMKLPGDALPIGPMLIFPPGVSPEQFPTAGGPATQGGETPCT